MIEASAIVRPSIPWTEPRQSVTAPWAGSGPMAQVPTGWWKVDTAPRTHAARASRLSVGNAGPGESSVPAVIAATGSLQGESSCLGHGVEHALEVVGRGEVGGMDPGRVARVGGSQPHPAA